jgi:hypothetical protein
MTTKHLITAAMFIGAGFIAFSPRAPYVGAGTDAHADDHGDCMKRCSDSASGCHDHAHNGDDHGRCDKDRADCEKACDPHR